MGYEARNRILNLRDAPLAGRNGHELATAPQIVAWSPAQSAVMIVESVLPGHPMPIHVGGHVIMGKMPDWTEIAQKTAAEIGARHADPLAWTPQEHHELNLVNAVAEFQRAALGLAAAAKGLREASEDKLPEAPEEGSTRRPDEPGRDANGSEVP